MSLTHDVVGLSAVCACFLGPRRQITCLRGFANSKGADQPAHLRGLISAFVISLMECIKSRLATSGIFNLNLSETQRQVFLRLCPFPGHAHYLLCFFTSTVSLPKSAQQPT